MQTFKKRILWAIYIICAALFFCYVLFPSDAVKEYLAGRVRQAHPDLTAEIGGVKPVFPPGLKLIDVSVYYLGRILADLDYLDIYPNIFSLFLSTTHLSFTGKGYGGTLKGRVDIGKNSAKRDIIINADLGGIAVKQIEALSAFMTHKISGNLDGTVTFRTNVPDQGLSGSLTLTDGQIEFSPPVLNQNQLSFRTIEAELMLNNNSLTIKRCQIEGNQLDADISGSVKFSGRSARKILDLSGNVKPHAALLAKLGKNIPQLLAAGNLESRGLPFKITGTMDSPRYLFK